MNDQSNQTPKPLPKKGLKTTEFWITLAALIGGVILIMSGNQKDGAGLIAFASAGYAVARGMAK